MQYSAFVSDLPAWKKKRKHTGRQILSKCVDTGFFLLLFLLLIIIVIVIIIISGIIIIIIIIIIITT